MSSFARERLLIDGRKVYKHNHGYVLLFIVPMFEDNYGYIIVTNAPETKVLVVDPGEPEVITSVVNYLQLSLDIILITHRHGDHVNGNTALKNSFPKVKVYGPVYEPIPEIDIVLSDKDIITVSNDVSIQVIHTPCHTKGHIVYLVTSTRDVDNCDRLLFTGDTLFIGGCGQFCQGKGSDMLKIMDELSALREETLVYCAHEYTVDNFRFAQSIDPLYEVYLKEYEAILDTGWPTVPSTIGKEIEQNVYMKCRTDELQSILSRRDSAASTMTELRNRHNKFIQSN